MVKMTLNSAGFVFFGLLTTSVSVSHISNQGGLATMQQCISVVLFPVKNCQKLSGTMIPTGFILRCKQKTNLTIDTCH